MKAAAYQSHVGRSSGSPRGGAGSQSHGAIQSLSPRGGGRGNNRSMGSLNDGGGDASGNGGGVRGFGTGGLRGRGPGAAGPGAAGGLQRGGLHTRRPGMTSSPNLLVLSSNNSEGSAGLSNLGGGKAVDMAWRESTGKSGAGYGNPRVSMSPIASAGTSPADSPMGTAMNGPGTEGDGTSPKPPSGLRISPPKTRTPSTAPGHRRGSSAGSGSGGIGKPSSPRYGATPVLTSGLGLNQSVDRDRPMGGSKSTSPTKRPVSTGSAGVGGLPRPPSLQGKLNIAGGTDSSAFFENFDSWV